MDCPSRTKIFTMPVRPLIFAIGGSFLATLHSADVIVTFATHLIGLCAAAVGLIWYIVRLKKDLSDRNKK